MRQLFVAAPLVEYVLDLVAATRAAPDIATGASPRSTLGLVQAAQAHAVVSLVAAT